MSPCKRPTGKPPLTWIQLVTKDLKNSTKHHNIKTPLNITSIQKLTEIAKDKNKWKKEIVRSMKSDL